MSEQTREAARQAGESLGEAAKHLRKAGDSAKVAGDRQLQQTVETLRKGAEQAQQDVSQKLGKDAAQKGQ